MRMPGLIRDQLLETVKRIRIRPVEIAVHVIAGGDAGRVLAHARVGMPGIGGDPAQVRIPSPAASDFHVVEQNIRPNRVANDSESNLLRLDRRRIWPVVIPSTAVSSMKSAFR